MDDKSKPWRTTAESQEGKAKSIIEDVFRRADKNDDGSLSLEEFQTFFADGILSSKELEELFRQIDTHKTNNLDTSELCEYFSKFWGPFEHIFATLDDLGSSITNAMTVTAQQYNGQSSMEQFATRFLLKETLNHMLHLQQPLVSAIESLEEQASEGKTPEKSDLSPPQGEVKQPRWQKRLLKSISSEPRGEQMSYALKGEVGRLAELIDKLESKVKLEVVEEEEVPQGKENTIVVVSRSVEATEESDKDFRQTLRTYTEGTTKQPGNLHVTVRSYGGTHRFTIYEVWHESGSLCSHYASKVSKAFRRASVDQLVGPEVTQSITLPASWWPLD